MERSQDINEGEGVRTLLVINARITAEAREKIARGDWPRKDYFELQRELDADVVDLLSLERGWPRLARRVFGAGLAQALTAWGRAGQYEAIFADRETTGFALAALLRLRRSRPRLTMIAHFLSSPKKRLLARGLRLRHAVDCMIVHSSTQQLLAERELGMRPDQVALIPYQVDEQFWRPASGPAERQICSVGLEFRDYGTLIKAVEGLDVQVVIAAASHWSKHQDLEGAVVPPNIRVASFDYAALRDLYAASSFVVVPLQEVDNQAGITVILEAMAMGRAVIVSHTRGQSDVIRDRRHQSRSLGARPTQPDWVRRLGANVDIAESPTGIYVVPGDPDELRRAIVYLFDHPEVAAELGKNGRRVLEASMSLDLFTTRLSGVIRGDLRSSHLSVLAPVTGES